MDPGTLALVTSLVTAGGSIAGGMLSKPSRPKESKMEKTRRKLVDDLILSLKGEGPFSDLYKADEATFQKSFVDPAKARFKNQIAPGIQQQYIYGGQQRGTGMEDQLLRAGVDLDQMLNESYMDYINKAQDRKAAGINSALGNATGGPGSGMSTGEAFQQSAGGYLSSSDFSGAVKDIINEYSKPSAQSNPNAQPARKGYESNSRYGLPNFQYNLRG